MPTQLYQAELEPGELHDTGMSYQRGDIWCIVNDDLQEFDVLPWGYLDYMSSDRPAEGQRILFRDQKLILKSTCFRDSTDWIPGGHIWIYISPSYPFTQCGMSIWSPY